MAKIKGVKVTQVSVEIVMPGEVEGTEEHVHLYYTPDAPVKAKMTCYGKNEFSLDDLRALSVFTELGAAAAIKIEDIVRELFRATVA